MNDATFGEMTRDGNGHWVASVPITFFRGFGAALEPGNEPAEEEPAPAPARRPPTKRQREARGMLGALAKMLGGQEREMLEAAMRMADRAAAGQLPAAEGKSDAAQKDQPADPLDPDVLFRQGRFRLSVNPGKNAPPSAAQRAAWERVEARGEAVWAEVLDAIFTEYRLQRPVRARWWAATFGNRTIARLLPEVADAEALKRLIRPMEIHVRPALDSSDPADVPIGIHFGCTWDREAVGVVLRDGRVASVGPGQDVFPVGSRAKTTIDHPTFGALRRAEGGDAWQGFVRSPAFSDFCQVADTRAKFRADPADFGEQRLSVAWEFTRGEFELSVYAPGGAVPTDAQADAWAAFRSDEAKHAGAIVGAIFQHYQETRAAIRRKWRDDFLDECVPKLDSADGLRELMQLRHVHLFPPARGGGVTIGFQFVCTWDTDSVAVRWRDGKVERLGTWDDAQPTESELKEAAARAPAAPPPAPKAAKQSGAPAKPAGGVKKATAPTPPPPARAPAQPDGPVTYELKPGTGKGGPASLTSPLLDPAMYTPGALKVHFTEYKGAGAAGGVALEPFERDSLADFLRNQAHVRRTLEAELAKDLDIYDPDESFDREKVWDLARVERLILEPRRVFAHDAAEAFEAFARQKGINERVKATAGGGNRSEARAGFILLVKVDWHDQDRLVTFRDGRVTEFRVGY